MKVLLIYPNVDCQVGFNYGLAFISAVLKRAGHATSLINLNEKLGPVPSPEEVAARVAAEAPGLVGMSIVTNQWSRSLEIAGAIKKAGDVPIIAGGVHPTMVPGEVLASGPFDYVCVGEGEEATLGSP